MAELMPYVGRALIDRLLKDSERNDLQAFERQNKVNRFLTPFEICHRYRLKPESVSVEDTDEMTRLYWIWRNREDSYLEKLPLGENLHETDEEERLSWIRFSYDNFGQKESNWAMPIVMAMVLLCLR